MPVEIEIITTGNTYDVPTAGAGDEATVDGAAAPVLFGDSNLQLGVSGSTIAHRLSRWFKEDTRTEGDHVKVPRSVLALFAANVARFNGDDVNLVSPMTHQLSIAALKRVLVTLDGVGEGSEAWDFDSFLDLCGAAAGQRGLSITGHADDWMPLQPVPMAAASLAATLRLEIFLSTAPHSDGEPSSGHLYGQFVASGGHKAGEGLGFATVRYTNVNKNHIASFTGVVTRNPSASIADLEDKLDELGRASPELFRQAPKDAAELRKEYSYYRAL